MIYFLRADACVKCGEGLPNPFAFATCEEKNVQDAVQRDADVWIHLSPMTKLANYKIVKLGCKNAAGPILDKIAVAQNVQQPENVALLSI